MKVRSTQDSSHHRLKFLIYGDPGVGKTTLASTIPEETLIISSEAGLLSLADHKIAVQDISMDDDDNEIPREDRVSRLLEVYEWICEKEQREKYKWIFLDSLTEISQNLVESLQEVYPEKKDGLLLWGEYNKRMMALIKTFRDLPYYNVVMTALQKEDKDENNRRYLTIDINGKLAKRTVALFDEVMWMHIHEDDDGNEKRMLLTGSHENISAKDRSGKLTEYEEPNLKTIVQKIRQQSNESNKKNSEKTKNTGGKK